MYAEKTPACKKYIMIPALQSLIIITTSGALIDDYGKNPSVADKISMPCFIGVGD